MKTFLKYATTFLAGGASVIYCISKNFTENTKYPREGAVVFEDDKMKITRITKYREENSSDIASIVYKNQTTNEES